MEEFCVRAAYNQPELSLIEFRGDHRSGSFPPVFAILEAALPELSVAASWPAPDDFLWTCSYPRGVFEISDDWGGLFIIPLSDPAQVVDELAQVLERSGYFKRVVWWAAELRC